MLISLTTLREIFSGEGTLIRQAKTPEGHKRVLIAYHYVVTDSVGDAHFKFDTRVPNLDIDGYIFSYDRTSLRAVDKYVETVRDWFDTKDSKHLSQLRQQLGKDVSDNFLGHLFIRSVIESASPVTTYRNFHGYGYIGDNEWFYRPDMVADYLQFMNGYRDTHS